MDVVCMKMGWVQKPFLGHTYYSLMSRDDKRVVACKQVALENSMMEAKAKVLGMNDW